MTSIKEDPDLPSTSSSPEDSSSSKNSLLPLEAPAAKISSNDPSSPESESWLPSSASIIQIRPMKFQINSSESPSKGSSLCKYKRALSTYRPIRMKPLVVDLVDPLSVEEFKKEREENHLSCTAEVLTSSLKELRLKGSLFLRTHASNHGLTNASRKLTSVVLDELKLHYAESHGVQLTEDYSEMIKEEPTTPPKPPTPPPPPDYPPEMAFMMDRKPYSRRKREFCLSPLVSSSLSGLKSLRTSVLRPEASLHQVLNSSRKAKNIVIEELWEHYKEYHSDEINFEEEIDHELAKKKKKSSL